MPGHAPKLRGKVRVRAERRSAGHTPSTKGAASDCSFPGPPDTKKAFRHDKSFAIVAAGALAACSNSNGTATAPSLNTFTYGNPVPVNTAQGNTASSASNSLNSIFSSASSSAPAPVGATAPFLADSLGASAFSAAVAIPTPAASMTQNPPAQLQALRMLGVPTRGTLLEASCASVSGNTATYSGCTYTDPEFGTIYTLNGTVSATPISVTWNVTGTVAYAHDGNTADYQAVWKGTMTFLTARDSSTTTSEFSGTYSENGQSGDFAYTVGLDFLSLVASPSCGNSGGLTSGTLEIRANFSGTNFFGYDNAGIEFDWTACDTVGIATSN